MPGGRLLLWPWGETATPVESRFFSRSPGSSPPPTPAPGESGLFYVVKITQHLIQVTSQPQPLVHLVRWRQAELCRHEEMVGGVPGHGHHQRPSGQCRFCALSRFSRQIPTQTPRVKTSKRGFSRYTVYIDVLYLTTSEHRYSPYPSHVNCTFL